jgi:hypothetical protein
MKILDNTRFMKLINGELVKEFNPSKDGLRRLFE